MSSYPVITSIAAGTPRNDLTARVGGRFLVKDRDVELSTLGFGFLAGNTGVHAVSVYRDSDNQLLGTASVSFASANPAPGALKYAAPASRIILLAGVAYKVVADVTAAGDSWLDDNTVLTTTDDVEVLSGVFFAGGVWTTHGAAGHCYGPVGFEIRELTAPTRYRAGLRHFEDFSEEEAWTKERGWFHRGSPSLVSFGRSHVKAAGPLPGTSIAGGVREGQIIEMPGGTWFQFVGAGNGAESWYVQLLVSTDRGTTWTLHGALDGVQYNKTSNPADGNWAARDFLYVSYDATLDLFILRAMSAEAVTNGRIPAPSYESDIFTVPSDPRGTWTFVRRDLVKGASGQFDDRDAYAGSVIEDGGLFHHFYSSAKVSSGHRSVGYATSATETGALTKHGEIPLPTGFRGELENPKGLRHPLLQRWVFMCNLIGTFPSGTNNDILFFTQELTDWSDATYINFLHPSPMDGYRPVGIPSPFYTAGGQALITEAGVVPITYDTDVDTGDTTDDNEHRSLFYAALEPSLYALTCDQSEFDALIRESFNRPDGSLDGDNGWVLLEGVASFTKSGGRLNLGTSALESPVMVNRSIMAADLRLSTFLTSGADASGAGLILRETGPNSYYLFDYEPGGGALTVTFYKKTVSGLTSLGSATGGGFVAGQPVEIAVVAQGTQFQVFVGPDLVATFTDATYTAPGAVGLRRGGAGGGSRFVENFSAAAITPRSCGTSFSHADIIFEFALDFETLPGGGFVAFKYREQANGDHYRIVAFSGGILILQKVVAGLATTLQAGTPVLRTYHNVSHRLRIEAIGDAHRAYLDGEQHTGWFDDTWASGERIGFTSLYARANVRLLRARTSDQVWLLNLTPGQRVVLRYAGFPVRIITAKAEAERVTYAGLIDEVEINGVSHRPEGGVRGGDIMDARPLISGGGAAQRLRRPDGAAASWWTSSGTVLSGVEPRTIYEDGTLATEIFLEAGKRGGEIEVVAESEGAAPVVFALRVM